VAQLRKNRLRSGVVLSGVVPLAKQDGHEHGNLFAHLQALSILGTGEENVRHLRIRWLCPLLVLASIGGIGTATGAAGTSQSPMGYVPAFWYVTPGGVVTGSPSYGSLSGLHLNRPIVGMAATPDGKGYWLVAADGGVFSFGDARFFGSMGGSVLNQPVVGMATTLDGGGYWLVAADGGIFSFGDAQFHGSVATLRLNKPTIGMAPTSDGQGYWLVASDGGVFTFGDASFYGSASTLPLAKPVTGIASTPDGKGYWLSSADGGVFSYGDAVYYGSEAYSNGYSGDMLTIIGPPKVSPDGGGYWLATAQFNNACFAFGDIIPYTQSGPSSCITNTTSPPPPAPPPTYVGAVTAFYTAEPFVPGD